MPGASELAVVTESAAVPAPPVTVVGVNVQLACDDERPDRERATSPAKPLIEPTVTVYETLPPASVPVELGEAATVRSGGYVVSRTLDNVTWSNSTLIRGDVFEAVARLRQEPGEEIQVTGSGELAHTLIECDLVDAYRLWVFPVVLGEGKRLFGRGAVPAGLKLVDTQISTTGVAIHTYERAGEIQYGSAALDEPSEQAAS